MYDEKLFMCISNLDINHYVVHRQIIVAFIHFCHLQPNSSYGG